MAIKVPDNFRQSDYGVEISIPKPDMECEKNEDGSFSLYARYNCDISDLAREAAREMYDKIEAELMDELLRLNGYVPERTCHMTPVKHGTVFDVWKFDCCGFEFAESGCERGQTELPGTWCPNCGARVVEEDE